MKMTTALLQIYMEGGKRKIRKRKNRGKKTRRNKEENNNAAEG